MKYVLMIAVAIAAMAQVSVADAGVTCTRYGNMVRCHDYGTRTTTRCTTYGNTTRCTSY